MTNTVLHISGAGQLGVMISVYADSVDKSLVTAWRSLERDVIGAAVEKIAEVHVSPDYTTEGRQKRIGAIVDDTRKSPELQTLRLQVERATARRDEVRQQILSPQTSGRIADLQGLFEAMVARDEAKAAAAELGTDALRIFSRYMTAIEERDDVALRALFPLRRFLSTDNRAAVDAQLLQSSPRAQEFASIEETLTTSSAIYQAAEADLDAAANASFG